MELSVIIASRNEEFLQNTIDDILSNIEGNTEIIVILDGYWPVPGVIDNPRLTIIHHTESIGQRAAINEGVRLSKAQYIMKCDAHCSFDKGFDVKLMADCKPDWTVIPRMYNLHAFDWVCECGKRQYQGPKPTCKCGKEMKKEIVWKPRLNRRTDFAMFDNELKFQYWRGYESRKEAKGDIADVMSFVGACFFMERKRYWELDGLDEKHGSWGQMGTEISCKSWLSGGRQVVNKKTWFAHMFRTQKDFSFPYPIKFSDQEAARKYSKNVWLNDRWPKAKYPLKWMIDKFAPVPTWDAKTPTLSVIIPARNEKYLQKTIDDIMENFETDFEIIIGLDDYDAKLKENPRVIIYRSDKRVGMRPMINILAKKARGRYLLKTDAHCRFDKGYDRKLIDITKQGCTVLGIRYELDVKKWERKERTNCDFRYLSHPDADPLGGLRGLAWHEWKKKTKGMKIAESMSLSGSGWLMEKKQFDVWGGLDENHGTFGQEGAEIACKTWLQGGRLLINRETWYAHWNRGKAPYALSRRQRDKSVDYSIDFWMNDRWHFQKYSFNWLIEHFKPVPGWPELYGKGIKAPSQGTLFKGAVFKMDDLWNKRIEICEPLKRWRLAIFYKAFGEVIDNLIKGKKYTDTEIRESRYYQYLVTHLAKKCLPVNQDEYIKKWNKHLMRKFKSAIKLFESIKKNGTHSPLEMYQKDGYLFLWRGYRRFVIMKKLGFKNAPVCIHKSIACKELPEMFKYKETKAKSIRTLAKEQFAKYGKRATDKHWVHQYTKVYDNLFKDLRNKRIKLLELGVLRGASLRLWHKAFPKGQIYGLDKNKTMWQEMTKDLDRVKVFVGMQEDNEFLKKVANHGQFDIIIDDCGHNPSQQLDTFFCLWGTLKPHGYYIIEDCYRSYLKKNKDVIVPEHLTSYVKTIYNDNGVLSVQFYYNLCVIQKGI